MKRTIQHFNDSIFRRVTGIAATLAPAKGVNQAMKMMRNLLLAGMTLSLCCSIGNAQLIYSNAFNGGAVSVNRYSLTEANDSAGGTSSAWWTVLRATSTNYLYENGTIGVSATTSLIPFTPENGYVYTLTASVTVPTMTAGKWITMGFAEYNPPLNTATDARFGSTEVNGNPWTYLTEGSGGDFFFPLRGTTTAHATLMPSPGTYTVQLKLDTTGSQWKASEYVNGTQVGSTYTYSSNPTITAVGVGQTTLNSSSGIQWNYLTLSATGSRSTSTVNETVTFSATGHPFNQGFGGLSYEKLSITNDNYFTSNNVSLVNLFSQLGPVVLRIGGGTVDTTGWNGISNTVPITSSQVDRLARFIKVLPNVSVIYGINCEHNTASSAAAEAAYVQSALGSQLLGFEIGNEPEYYTGTYSGYSGFLSHWRILAAAITNAVPDWAVTNGGSGWVLDGADAGQGQLSAYTDPFASDESGVLSLLTQHYYRASGGLSSDTMQTILTADSFLKTLAVNIADSAYTGGCALGARISECGSTSAGGTLEVSDVYGAALWSLDFMGTAATNSVQGVNFHGGGRSPYSPIVDDGTTILQVGPEFYGLKMFSLIPAGTAVPAPISPTPSINFTAYGVKNTSANAFSALLINKEVNDTVSASVHMGSETASAALIQLTSPNLYCTNNYTLGGSAIYTDGTWTGGVQQVLTATGGALTVSVPPISADLLIPITVGSKPVAVKTGPNFDLRFTLNGGSANFSYSYGSNTDTHFFMGDWNGDGTMTPGIVRTNSVGQWEWILRNSNSSGSPDYDFAYGTAKPGDVLIVGDWDGNGTWTPGIVRTNSSGQLEWMLRNDNAGGGANYDFVYGDAGDIPFTGDWDGNGTFTPGCVKAGSNTWSLRNSNNSGVANLTFGYGSVGDTPIVGDWDGNGTWTCGVIKSGTNTWDLRNSNSSGSAQISFSYGSSGDTFLVWQ